MKLLNKPKEYCQRNIQKTNCFNTQITLQAFYPMFSIKKRLKPILELFNPIKHNPLCYLKTKFTIELLTRSVNSVPNV